MKLLILAPEFTGNGGGIATFYRNLAMSLRDMDVSIRLIEGSAMHAGEKSPRVVNGVAVETLQRDRLVRWWDRFPSYAAVPALRRHLAAAWAMWEQADFGAGADIVEATDWGLLFLPPAVEARMPLVVQGHGSVGQLTVHDPFEGEESQGVLVRLLESNVLSRRPLMQTYSHANAAFWRAETRQDVMMVRPAAPPSGAPTVLSPSNRGLVVGRIQRWKGAQVLCEALACLGERAPPMDWVGRDMPFGRIQTSTADYLATRFPNQWGKGVERHSPVEPAEVARMQAQALFNVVPSTWDVFNFTAVEAMASGRPTLVSRGAGASDLIANGENGFSFPANDGPGLAAAIERVLSASPGQRARIGRAARETVRREMDPETIGKARVDAYRATIASFHDASPEPIGGWLGEICRPSPVGAPGSDAFLGQFSIRQIARHLGSRLSDRIGEAVPLRMKRP